MSKSKLSKTSKKCYSSFEKRKIVEEISSGFYSIDQARENYILPKENYGKGTGGILKYHLFLFQHKALLMKKTPCQEVQELKKRLLEVQALNGKVQLKNMVLKTMIDMAEKNLNVEIRWSLVPNRPSWSVNAPFK